MKGKYFSGRNFGILYILIASLSIYGCDRNRNHPGWDYFPDMFYSTAYETFSKNKAYADSITMRVPAPGSLSRNSFRFNYTLDPESRKQAGLDLVNPFQPTPEALLRGVAEYTIFCIDCHGAAGDGNGHLFKSGVYPMKPRALVSEYAENLKDGEIFHTIFLGYGSMGAHGSQIRTDDIWKTVLYVRKLQKDARQAGSVIPVK